MAPKRPSREEKVAATKPKFSTITVEPRAPPKPWEVPDFSALVNLPINHPCVIKWRSEYHSDLMLLTCIMAPTGIDTEFVNIDGQIVDGPAISPIPIPPSTAPFTQQVDTDGQVINVPAMADQKADFLWTLLELSGGGKIEIMKVVNSMTFTPEQTLPSGKIVRDYNLQAGGLSSIPFPPNTRDLYYDRFVKAAAAELDKFVILQGKSGTLNPNPGKTQATRFGWEGKRGYSRALKNTTLSRPHSNILLKQLSVFQERRTDESTPIVTTDSGYARLVNDLITRKNTFSSQPASTADEIESLVNFVEMYSFLFSMHELLDSVQTSITWFMTHMNFHFLTDRAISSSSDKTAFKPVKAEMSTEMCLMFSRYMRAHAAIQNFHRALFAVSKFIHSRVADPSDTDYAAVGYGYVHFNTNTWARSLMDPERFPTNQKIGAFRKAWSGLNVELIEVIAVIGRFYSSLKPVLNSSPRQ